ncbi:hypothetical protein [Algibacter lectus]|uniref:Uncharacterized protein n=1 Tax=Algibacter lectus TaxID=221126 RepID=A0A4R8MIN2_9FLAO|nr:hypothetical protein [Algibacter lectus]MWW26847.1 hypothetical protein [Algibacter lectus]TDY64212.1 hypothetical protein DFQ06_1117 [Algibacter lectus]
MSREHNPIARLITQIQQKWVNDIADYPEIQLIRWLIKPDQKRLYKGFLKLESSEHGSLPCIPVVLLTPFNDIDKHSRSLVNDWIESFKNDKDIQKAIANNDFAFDWDVELYENKLKDSENDDVLLLEMLESFQKAIPDNELPLVLSLFPNAVQREKDYKKWLDKLVSIGLPKHVKIMLFDDVNARDFDDVMEKYSTISKSLSVPLDLDGAINKLATMGNPNDPEVKFRSCLIEMGNSVSKNDLSRLHKWGNKGLEVTKVTGNKSTYATAHVVYAGYLFNFKEFEMVDNLLQKGMALAKQGLLGGDKICEPIIVQNYGLQASSKQLQKQKNEAVTLFCKQADAAIQYNLGAQALSAWWLAYSVIKKKDKAKYELIVVKAYHYGTSLPKDVLKATCMNFISADCYTIHENKRDLKTCEDIDIFMRELDGVTWRENIEEKRKEMEKRKLTLLNWF